ncbi:MAG: M20/M25/M40 family metallo-hydrolase [Myxococcota bacterium]|nr:M20/M25/M40 family metallo-hydrolase [Myxococcota bacterium]
MVSLAWWLLVAAGWAAYFWWPSKVPIEAVKAQYWFQSVAVINGPDSSRIQSTPAPGSEERLMADVNALAFPRWTQTERKRARAYLAHRLTNMGYTPSFHAYSEGINVVVDIPGTAEHLGALLVGAHYDTVQRSPGADDNASGVAAVLEIGRRLRHHGSQRDVILVFFDGEERGLEGSRAYMAGPGRTRKLHGAVILEMLGYACETAGCQRTTEGMPRHLVPNHGQFLAVVGNLSGRKFLLDWRSMKLPKPFEVVIIPVLEHGWPVPDSRRSDHAAFWAQNIDAVMLTDTANFRNPHYHETSDKPATLSPEFLASNTEYAWQVVKRMIRASPIPSQPAPADVVPDQ